MAKKSLELDTPFRPGELVMTTCELPDITEGTEGKVEVANGLGNWRRYWVRFDGNDLRGQVSHSSLVRPAQINEWRRREEDRVAAAAKSAEPAAATADADAGGGGDASGGAASLIPAALLERSKAAKARLLG